MKVLHMISGGDTGGAKTHVFSLMEKLPKMCDVKVVCFIKGQFFDELQDIDVQSELIEQKNRLDMSVLQRLCEICRDDKIDIIHSHGARANFIAKALKKKVDIPVVTTIHSDYLLDFDGIYKKLIYTSLNVSALKKLDYYIAVSSNFKDMLIERKFRPNSIFTVYNGMDYSKPFEYEEKESFAKRIGIEYNPDITYVGLIGRHDYVKGHDVFVKMVKEVTDAEKNVHFVIAGDGEQRGALESLVKELGVESHITFAGFIKDIYSFINFIDINTLSSRCESFPYVLMEGARMKKATVSSDVGGISDLIESGKTGLLFESENYKDFAQKILTLVKDKDLALKYGQALFDRATQNFSNENLAKTHIDIYKAILEDAKSDKKYDAVISGYYGFNNSGDDALLLGMLKSLYEINPNFRCLVLSANPALTKKQYRIDSVKRFDFCAIRKAIKNSRMLISGGGSLIQDATSYKSLLYYLYVINYAKKCGLSVMLYANGIGPLKEKNIGIVQKALRGVDYITLRDNDSSKLLSKMDIGPVPVKKLSDPAILVEPSGCDRVHEILMKNGIEKDTEYMCVAVRPWKNSDPEFEEKIAEVCDEVYEKYGLTSVFLLMKPATDRKISHRISEKTKHKSYVLDENLKIQDIMGIVGNAKAVLGMRLHMLIYSACVTVPCVALSYDPKIDGFMKGAELEEFCVPCQKIDAQKVVGLCGTALENSKEISDKLLQNKKNLLEMARENARICVNLLEKN